VHFFFLWVDTVGVALARVKERVLKGGHDVPQAVIHRRFGRSIRNFFLDYRVLADSWYLFDNTGTRPELIAVQKAKKLRIMKPDIYRALAARYGEK
jgi:predicted ABC-type ATPase